MENRLPTLIRDRLLSGCCIGATVVTLSSNYRSVPDIPLSDYVAGIQVCPMSNGQYRISYREISEEMLQWEYDYDRLANVSEEFIVETVEEVEQVLSRYVTNFSWLTVGRNRYASG